MQTRKNIRLPQYDYSCPGFYFVTVCTDKKQKILSSVRRGDACHRPSTSLTNIGQIAKKVLRQIEQKYDFRKYIDENPDRWAEDKYFI